MAGSDEHSKKEDPNELTSIRKIEITSKPLEKRGKQ
jgi:hypothetical protein